MLELKFQINELCYLRNALLNKGIRNLLVFRFRIRHCCGLWSWSPSHRALVRLRLQSSRGVDVRVLNELVCHLYG
jgi:hypothetical protein